MAKTQYGETPQFENKNKALLMLTFQMCSLENGRIYEIFASLRCHIEFFYYKCNLMLYYGQNILLNTPPSSVHDPTFEKQNYRNQFLS